MCHLLCCEGAHLLLGMVQLLNQGRKLGRCAVVDSQSHPKDITCVLESLTLEIIAEICFVHSEASRVRDSGSCTGLGFQHLAKRLSTANLLLLECHPW